ncbi:hypothetical protein D5086_021436 [Populus alba]|uniref:Uncharacterized protein n=1 Tax=Populus alba TaxID=43335 RepID=A0ACC4BDV5_POPAL
MNFFTRPPFNPWDLPPSLFLYCPRYLQLLLLNVSALEILVETKVYFMEGSVPTMAAPEGTCLLFLGLIFTASMDLSAMTRGREIGSKIGAILCPYNGLIHVANYAKLPHNNSTAARSLYCPPSTSSLFANDTSVAGSASIASHLPAIDSSSTSQVGLNLVVDFYSYSLQQDTTLSSSFPASPPITSRHPMVLHLR